MPTNKAKLRKASGSSYSELRVEFSKGRNSRKPLSAKAAPTQIFPNPGKMGAMPLG